MKKVKLIVGLAVRYFAHPDQVHSGQFRKENAAVVTAVNDDDTVHLTVFTIEHGPLIVGNVPVIGESDETGSEGRYARVVTNFEDPEVIQAKTELLDAYKIANEEVVKAKSALLTAYNNAVEDLNKSVKDAHDRTLEVDKYADVVRQATESVQESIAEFKSTLRLTLEEVKAAQTPTKLPDSAPENGVNEDESRGGFESDQTHA